MRTAIMFSLALALVSPTIMAHAGESVGATRAKAIAPFLDEQTVIVAYVDLTRLKPDLLIDQAVELIPDLAAVQAGVKASATAVVNQLRLAGVKQAYLVVSLADMSFQTEYRPLVVVPLGADADENRLQIAFDTLPFEVKERRGPVFVACRRETLERLKQQPPDPRPELASAFEAAGDAVVQVLVLPPAYSRRVIEELMPKLPETIAGGSSTILTHGFRWAAFGFDPPPQTGLWWTIQSQDAAAVQALLAKWDDLTQAIGRRAEVRQALPRFDDLAKLLRPQVREDRLRLGLDAKNGGIDSLLAVLKSSLDAARQEAQRSQSRAP